MHVLDRQLNIGTADLDNNNNNICICIAPFIDPLDNDFTLEIGNLPLISWKSLEPRWNVVCHCGKCAHVTCSCSD